MARIFKSLQQIERLESLSFEESLLRGGMLRLRIGFISKPQKSLSLSPPKNLLGLKPQWGYCGTTSHSFEIENHAYGFLAEQVLKSPSDIKEKKGLLGKPLVPSKKISTVIRKPVFSKPQYGKADIFSPHKDEKVLAKPFNAVNPNGILIKEQPAKPTNSNHHISYKANDNGLHPNGKPAHVKPSYDRDKNLLKFKKFIDSINSTSFQSQKPAPPAHISLLEHEQLIKRNFKLIDAESPKSESLKYYWRTDFPVCHRIENHNQASPDQGYPNNPENNALAPACSYFYLPPAHHEKALVHAHAKIFEKNALEITLENFEGLFEFSYHPKVGDYHKYDMTTVSIDLSKLGCKGKLKIKADPDNGDIAIFNKNGEAIQHLPGPSIRLFDQ